MKAQLLARSLIAISILACASAHTRPQAGVANAAFPVYEQHGLIELPFRGLGQFFFLAGATADSTKVLCSLSYQGRPSDEVDIDLTRDQAVVHAFQVRVADFQQTITLPPGPYRLGIGLDTWPIVVPRVGRSSLATPIPMRDGRALPRSTAIVGRDTAIDVYLEAYGASDVPMTLSAPGWRDTVALEHHGNTSDGTVRVPLSRLGPGATTLVFARGRDSIAAPVFVTFGSWTAVSFEELLRALRYFAPADQIGALRQAPADERARVWAMFLARYGNRLPDYLDRIREANKRYGEEGINGWETDRGSVYVQLGDPDQVFVEPDVEIWVYMRYFGRLEFDHRRLIPESHDMLATLVARARSAR